MHHLVHRGSIPLMILCVMHLLSFASTAIAQNAKAASNNPPPKKWLHFKGANGPSRKDGLGLGKHIVLVSGDEEYRSEEAMPMLAKLLTVWHGFDTTVLFAIDPKTGIINPNNQTNIPGLKALAKADLLIIFTRFRNLPEDQMKMIDNYLKSGRPVIGLRTSTHAFKIKKGQPYDHYSNGYRGENKAWHGGFGKLVLGEQWVNHHGRHKKESTRGIVGDKQKDHPIARGIEPGSIWGPSDVYGIKLKELAKDVVPIVYGQVVEDMSKDGKPISGKKNDPMMPVAWTKSYQLPGGKKGRVFTTTMGASNDLLAEGTRRMIVNGVYWLLNLEVPKRGTNVDFVGQYKASMFSFRRDWEQRKLRVESFDLVLLDEDCECPE